MVCVVLLCACRNAPTTTHSNSTTTTTTTTKNTKTIIYAVSPNQPNRTAPNRTEPNQPTNQPPNHQSNNTCHNLYASVYVCVCVSSLHTNTICEQYQKQTKKHFQIQSLVVLESAQLLFAMLCCESHYTCTHLGTEQSKLICPRSQLPKPPTLPNNRSKQIRRNHISDTTSCIHTPIGPTHKRN